MTALRVLYSIRVVPHEGHYRLDIREPADIYGTHNSDTRISD